MAKSGNQLSFGEFELPSRPPETFDNFFFALQPDADTAAGIVSLAASLRRDCGLRGRAFSSHRLHVTLLGLGGAEFSTTGLMAFANELASLVALSAFKVSFERVVSFSGKSPAPRKHPIVLLGGYTEGVEALVNAQVDALSILGIRKAAGKITPHMTLLYDEKNIPERIIEPIGWTVKEYVLIQSHVGQNRPYTVLGRWPLTAK
jgi:RNA 2',3'-cyclic 3'-phosphodiesterase